jgi:hypothetical protein
MDSGGYSAIDVKKCNGEPLGLGGCISTYASRGCGGGGIEGISQKFHVKLTVRLE